MLKDFVIDDDSVGIRAQGNYVDLHNEFDLAEIRLNPRKSCVELEFVRSFSGPTKSLARLLLQFHEVDWIQISPGALSCDGEVLELGYKEPSDKNHDWLLHEKQASPDAHLFLRLSKDEFVRVHARKATAALSPE
jgi:hypothetical protein